jgi:hypothetical protein
MISRFHWQESPLAVVGVDPKSGALYEEKNHRHVEYHFKAWTMLNVIIV